MKRTFSQLTADLKKMYPSLADDLPFQKLEKLANLRMYRDQGIEFDGLQKDYDAYIMNRAAMNQMAVEAPKVICVTDSGKSAETTVPATPTATKSRLKE